MKLMRILCIWLCCAAGLGGAQAATVAIVLSERSAGYLNVAKVLESELERSGLAVGQVVQYAGAEWIAERAASAPKLVISLGAEALKQVLDNEGTIPVIAALLPRIGYERIVRESNRRLPNQLTAVFLDQPFGRRVDLVKLVLPDAKRVGVLWGPESVVSQAALAQTLQGRGLGMVEGVVESSASLFGSLKSVLDEADIVFAVADPQVYSSSTIANVLLATYRARVPVMAFSPAYVKAGALMAIYATPQQIGVQAAGMARLALQGNTLPPPQYPHDFEISVNQHVARSLGLSLDVRNLTEKLLSGSKRP